MYNLLMKELRLGVSPWFYALPFVTGALMLIPGWVYFVVTLYVCMITIPNIFAGYKSQNDLMFTNMLPVSKKDIVKSKVGIIVFLELLHVIVAVVFGAVSLALYPNIEYIFFKPTAGFWGLTLIMLGIFNVCFIPMHYKTAYKYGSASIVSIAAAFLFAAGAEWLGISNAFVRDLFKGSGADDWGIQLSVLLAGALVFAALTIIAYRAACKRFKKVEI
ncbi:ABC-2 transporter permease [Saccharibacillus alkalitolerans]|uniref:ABC-2 transporter permease n=1 Tax=Saccharibacillus alkalitolerans TaxID=2705290 RepID=A0ABX0F2A4_9BACL|nr:ABC-2 transporter permease [Saccharibacillus alkalitolerans]NGZ74687.1 hypothetical protein [Saccharibacillus alkalitolerans]